MHFDGRATIKQRLAYAKPGRAVRLRVDVLHGEFLFLPVNRGDDLVALLDLLCLLVGHSHCASSGWLWGARGAPCWLVLDHLCEFPVSLRVCASRSSLSQRLARLVHDLVEPVERLLDLVDCRVGDLLQPAGDVLRLYHQFTRLVCRFCLHGVSREQGLVVFSSVHWFAPSLLVVGCYSACFTRR